jgi:uncharacterized membrane protein
MKTIFIKLIPVLAVFISLLVGMPVAAADTSPTSSITPTLSLTTRFSKLEASYTGITAFPVTLFYSDNSTGAKPKVFDISVNVPKDWSGSVSNDKNATSVQITLLPNSASTVSVNIAPPTTSIAAPGEYMCNFQATSGDIKSTLSLGVELKPTYYLYLSSDNNSYYATRSKANYFDISASNYSPVAINQVVFTATSPEGWTVTFDPPAITSLPAAKIQPVRVHVTPKSSAQPGDYYITLNASSSQINAPGLKIRFQVEQSSPWLIISIVLAAIALVGISFVFFRFHKR